MSIEVKDEHYYHGMWFADYQGKDGKETGNFMGCLMQVNAKDKEAPELWRFTGRLRAIYDDKMFGSKDSKDWFEAESPTKEEALAKIEHTMKGMAEVIAQAGGEMQEPEFFELECWGDKFTEKIAENPPEWMNVQTIENKPIPLEE